MHTIQSLDPRINRLSIPQDFDSPPTETEPLDQFQTYEVFHLEKSGGRHLHVGSIHAPSPELAIILAKEQYGRRGKTINIWVVSSEQIFSMDMRDADMFATTPDKSYREVTDYARVRDKVEKFKKEQKKG